MRKIRLFLMTTLVLLGSALTSWAESEPYSGTPSATIYRITASNYTNYGFTAENWQAFENYYAIASAEDLYCFADSVNGGAEQWQTANAVLTDDIVVNENVLNANGSLNGTPTYSWTPIGTSSKNYKGTFDGNGHTISGLYFNKTTNNDYPDGGNYVGLIGYAAKGAAIKNVGVVDSYLYGRQYVGGICGCCYNLKTNITNCYNTGTVSGTQFIGGICGDNGTQTKCYNTGTVSSSDSNVGGICGIGGTQTNCYNTGMVLGRSSGICGYNGTQTNCYYLAGSATYSGGGVSATAEEFASGKIAYLLNGSTSEGNLAWYQTIGTDTSPVFDNTHGVVYLTQPCTSGGFSNTEGAVTPHPSMDAIGHCTACGQFIAQGTLVTESNHSSLNLTADFVGYYAISNTTDLYWFANEVNNGNTTINAVLTDNIKVNENVLTAEGELNGTPTYSWTPIGTSSKNFKGTFDGNGHTISGLYFNNTTNKDYPNGGNSVGLIGRANGAKIKNVGVVDTYFKGYYYVSGICGYSTNTTISNCHNTGTVSGTNNVGGICGFDYDSNTNITNCHNTGTVSCSGTSYYVGGICGHGGTQTNCYNTGTVSGSYYYVGGICGGYGTQTNCYNIGKVSGYRLVGGICGGYGTQTNCYNTGTVSGFESVGGICGGHGTQTNCCYLAGCAKDGNNVVQYGVGNATKGQTTADVAGKTMSATAEAFASGEVAYLLNGGTSEGNLAWYQTIGTDALPVWDNTHGVVYKTLPCPSFSNDANNTHKDHSLIDVTGYCTSCCQFLVHGTLVTESNYSSLNLTADFIGYYAICKSAELYWFANEVNNGNTTLKAVLTDDIVVNENVLNADGTLNGTPTHIWTPIGTSSKKYVGTFDGNGHTIGGLYFSNTTNNAYPAGGIDVGLIGYADGATIKNVGVVDSYFKGYYYVSGICGRSSYYTNIINCYNSGTVSGYEYVSGICSNVLYNVYITNCYNTGKIICSSRFVGGISSYSDGEAATITNCYNTGTITGPNYVGGICGYSKKMYIKLTNCYNTGTVSGTFDEIDGIGINCYPSNCYCLAGSCSKINGGAPATAEEFASGKIGYLLNKNNNNAWYQDLYSDGYPLLDNTHNLASGYIEEDGDTYTVVGDMLLATNYEIAAGKTLNVPAGTSLTTTGNAVITNNGTLRANGTLSGNNLAGNGTFITNRLSLCSISNLNESYVYKSTAYTLEDGLSGVAVNTTILGKTFTLDATISPSYTNNRNAGTATISWTNSADENDVLSGQFEITPKTLAISNIKAENKVYDGNTTTTVSYTADVFDGDKVTFGTAATFNDKTAATGKTVSFDYTKSGADANNYAFATTTGTTTANIEQRELVISSTVAAGKVYDGNTTTTVAIAASNIVSGDVVNFGTEAAFEDKNVGTNKTVNFTYTKSGADAANYKFAAATGTAKANITARELVLSNFKADSKVYDGTTDATGSFSDDRVSGDMLEFSYDVEFDNENAANDIDIYFSNIAISGGADKDNYYLDVDESEPKAKANITPVTDEVVVTVAMPTRTVVYNGQGNRYTVSSESDVISCNSELYFRKGYFGPVDNNDFQTYMQNIQQKTDVNEYMLGWTAEMFKNNSPNFTNVKFSVTDGKLIITPKTGVVVTVTENSGEVVYNTEEQSIEGYTASIDDELGIYSEDDFTFSGTATVAGTTVGTYPMEISAADFSNTNANYADVEFVIVDGALTITQAPEAPNKPAATMETRYIVTQLVALPENWKWADEQQALEEGDNVATANYDGADKGNYEIESVDVIINRLPCLHDQGNERLYILEATCTHMGYTGNMSCMLCGKIYQYGDSVPALGHAFDTVTIAATCTEVGYKELTCSRCNHVEHIDIVPANGHTADSVVFENIVEATCTEAGSKDSVVYCSVCHIELSRDAIVISAAGHKADSVAFENIVEATRTAAGSYDSVVYCSVCKVELSRTTVEVPQILAETIKLASAPTKVEYLKGEQLDVTGGKISVGYSDNTTDELDMLAEWISGFDSEKIGTQQLMVTFESVSSTLTTTFDVTVKEEENNQGGNENQGGNNEGGNENQGGENTEPATAIADDAAPAVNIYAYQNIIVVENATDEIYVYNAMGTLVYRDAARHISTTATITINGQGVYIVKTGNVAKRVMIY